MPFVHNEQQKFHFLNFFETKKGLQKKILTSKNGYDKIILLRNLFDASEKKV